MSYGCSPSYGVQVNARGPHPTLQVCDKFRKVCVAKRGKIDVNMMVRDDGVNAWRDSFRPPFNGAFDASLPSEKLWWVLSLPTDPAPGGMDGRGYCLLSDTGPETSTIFLPV